MTAQFKSGVRASRAKVPKPSEPSDLSYTEDLTHLIVESWLKSGCWVVVAAPARDGLVG